MANDKIVLVLNPQDPEGGEALACSLNFKDCECGPDNVPTGGERAVYIYLPGTLFFASSTVCKTCEITRVKSRDKRRARL